MHVIAETTVTFLVEVAIALLGHQDVMKLWPIEVDRNERLDRDEAKSVYNLADNEIFEEYDINSDGSINFTEFSYFMQQSPWVKSFTHPSEY